MTPAAGKDNPPGAAEPTRPGRKRDLGARIHEAEETAEKALRDAVASVENRIMIASMAADETGDPLTNTLDFAAELVHPPDIDSKPKQKKRKPAG